MHPDLANQANELLAEYQRVAALPTGASRVPEINKVKKMSERFKHREESHGRQVRRGTLPGAGIAGSGTAAGTAAAGGADAGESVKEKLDKSSKTAMRRIACCGHSKGWERDCWRRWSAAGLGLVIVTRTMMSWMIVFRMQPHSKRYFTQWTYDD